MKNQLVAVAAIATMIACKKTEDKAPAVAVEVAASREVEPKKLAESEEGPFHRVWRGIRSSKSGCEDFDYFPDGGMRNMACHAKTIVSYADLGKLVPRIWRAGPHGSMRLRLDAEDDFGKYDPAFVTWLVEHAVPAATSPSFKETTRPIYGQVFQPLARVYLRAALQLEKNPELVARETRYLEAYLANPTGERPLDKLSTLEPSNMYNLYAPALAFWIRRRVDGTAKEFEKGLRRLMATYEPETIRELERADLSIAVPVEAPPTADKKVADGPLDTMIEAAWRGLGATKIGCPNQFAYEPGGMRVGYCYVVPLIDYAVIRSKLAVPIFLSGPHGDKLELDSEQKFGHYNPVFVRWMVDHAIPASKNKVLRQATQSTYDQRLRVAARAFYAAHRRLKDNPSYFQAEKQKYEKFVKSGGDKPYWSYWDDMPGAIYEAQAIGGTGVAFWLRRAMDGTDTVFVEGLEKLLRTYDADFLAEAERLGFNGMSKRPDLFGEPSPDEAP